jgi:hypothetical protein
MRDLLEEALPTELTPDLHELADIEIPWARDRNFPYQMEAGIAVGFDVLLEDLMDEAIAQVEHDDQSPVSSTFVRIQ